MWGINMTIQQFLNTSYTAYHTVANCKTMLDKAGFVEITLACRDIQRAGKYYIVNNGSSIVAFVVGKQDRFVFSLSHTDSPCYRIKGNQLVQGNGVVRANVEMYGSALSYSFLDRQLLIAGRLIVQDNNGVATEIVNSNYNVVVPSVAIHHNRSANEGLALNVQVDMLPIVGLDGTDIYSSLTSSKVLDADLYVVPATQAFVAGIDNQLLCSSRLDNLTSVYSSIRALIDSHSDNIAMCCCFDNEEIGNNTKQGADSSWLYDIVQCIATNIGMDTIAKSVALNSGLALSIDNGHAVHPAHPEKYDITEKVYMGGGVVIKHNTRYATDALSSGIVKKCLADNNITYQDYYNRSDLPSGGTLGLSVATALNINVVDIGIAQLAMHSACETAHLADIDTMYRAVKCVYDSNIAVHGDKADV